MQNISNTVSGMRNNTISALRSTKFLGDLFEDVTPADTPAFAAINVDDETFNAVLQSVIIPCGNVDSIPPSRDALMAAVTRLDAAEDAGTIIPAMQDVVRCLRVLYAFKVVGNAAAELHVIPRSFAALERVADGVDSKDGLSVLLLLGEVINAIYRPTEVERTRRELFKQVISCPTFELVSQLALLPRHPLVGTYISSITAIICSSDEPKPVPAALPLLRPSGAWPGVIQYFMEHITVFSATADLAKHMASIIRCIVKVLLYMNRAGHIQKSADYTISSEVAEQLYDLLSFIIFFGHPCISLPYPTHYTENDAHSIASVACRAMSQLLYLHPTAGEWLFMPCPALPQETESRLVYRLVDLAEGLGPVGVYAMNVISSATYRTDTVPDVQRAIVAGGLHRRIAALAFTLATRTSEQPSNILYYSLYVLVNLANVADCIGALIAPDLRLFDVVVAVVSSETLRNLNNMDIIAQLVLAVTHQASNSEIVGLVHSCSLLPVLSTLLENGQFLDLLRLEQVVRAVEAVLHVVDNMYGRGAEFSLWIQHLGENGIITLQRLACRDDAASEHLRVAASQVLSFIGGNFDLCPIVDAEPGDFEY